MRLFDSHCHLAEEAFDGDREQVLRRMSDAGVRRALVSGYDPDSSRKALACAKAHPGLTASVGVHPLWSESWGEDVREELAELCAAGEVRAIGEIGLDYREKEPSARECQRRVCEAQLELAAGLGLPVCLHIVRAHGGMIALLKRYGSALRGGMCHGFSGSWEEAQEFLKLGMYISIGCAVMNPDAKKALRCAATVPEDRLLLETDSPWQARGEAGRSEPAAVSELCERVAVLRGVRPEALADVAYRNAEALFGM